MCVPSWICRTTHSDQERDYCTEHSVCVLNCVQVIVMVKGASQSHLCCILTTCAPNLTPHMVGRQSLFLSSLCVVCQSPIPIIAPCPHPITCTYIMVRARSLMTRPSVTNCRQRERERETALGYCVCAASCEWIHANPHFGMSACVCVLWPVMTLSYGQPSCLSLSLYQRNQFSI